MVNKCCAYGCKSGYVGHTPSETRITFHSFPPDAKLREKWIRANPRKDFVPTKNSQMCSLHFQDTDFVEESSDKNTTRRQKLGLQPAEEQISEKGCGAVDFSQCTFISHVAWRYMSYNLLLQRPVVTS